jgi:hypothetical protein
MVLSNKFSLYWYAACYHPMRHSSVPIFFVMCQGIINNPVLVSQCFSGQRRGQTVAISTNRTAARHTSLSSTWSNSPRVYWLHQNTIFRSVLHHSSFLHSIFQCKKLISDALPWTALLTLRLPRTHWWICPSTSAYAVVQNTHQHPPFFPPTGSYPNTELTLYGPISSRAVRFPSSNGVYQTLKEMRTCGEHNVSWLHTTSRCVASWYNLSIMEVMRSRLFTVWQMNEDEQGRSSCEDRCTAIASCDDGTASKMRHVCS